MHWFRGSALFLAGTLAGMFLMQTASSQQKPMPGMHLNHFGLYVKDLDASTEFYTKKLGFRKAFTFTDAEHKPVVYLQMNRDTFLELSPADPTHPLGFSHGGIVADDIETSVALLKQEGVKVEDVHLGATKAQIANMWDPDRVRLELSAYPPESLQGKAIASWK